MRINDTRLGPPPPKWDTPVGCSPPPPNGTPPENSDLAWFCFGFAVAFKTLVGVTFLVGALRVLVLRAGFAAVDLETVEAVGIREKRVYSSIIQKKG